MVNNICVIGNSLYKYLIAVVIPNAKEMEKIAKRFGMSYKEDKDLVCNSEKVNEIFKRKMVRHAKLNALRRYEIPKEYILVTDEWIPETGLVTASFKLKRKNIEARYMPQIKEAFDRLDCY